MHRHHMYTNSHISLESSLYSQSPQSDREACVVITILDSRCKLEFDITDTHQYCKSREKINCVRDQ